MSIFSQEIYQLTSLALSELDASQASGRTMRNVLSEAHYLGAWVTTAIKKKRFDSIVLATLQLWQKKARSLGKNAGLKEQFTYLQKCYNRILDEKKESQAINIEQFTALYAALTEQQWLVTTDLEVVDKLNRHSDGKDSLIVCATQIENCFDEQGVLIKPISLYVRGNQQTVITLAFEQHILLHKQTDYKSKVKYHGEFVVYPHNDGNFLPELPKELN
ncbi:DUF2913 family protein [Psychromonas sp. PT13]|uniref:DUF2913 family protein n=1 Tax=Psychromonas sp. PT13 TaxID=3439547 RepID=UPI003EC1142F